MSYFSGMLACLAIQGMAMMVPGQNHLLLMTMAPEGRRASGLAVLGIATAGLVFSSGIMLSVWYGLEDHSQRLFLLVNLLGAAYLLYLGLKLLIASWQERKATGNTIDAPAIRIDTAFSAFRAGFLVNISNTKSALFFASIFATTLPLAELTASQAIMAIMAFFVNSLFFHSLVAHLFSMPSIRRKLVLWGKYIRVFAGLVFSAFGIAIAVLTCYALGAQATTTTSDRGNNAPQRVVSMNLCTDQLAMLLAAPGQLLSVSYIALDPRSSAMVEQARAYDINHGLAEEIYLMQPDLVIAGSFSTRATVDMLERLGIPVAVFDPAYSLEDVRARITQMGEVLHRQDAAQATLDTFDAGLAKLQAEVEHRPRAVLYHANGYTQGDNTLAGQILIAAGFSNAAEESGFAAGSHLPLEILAMTDPDFVITARPYPGASRAEEVMDHPVVHALRKRRATATMTDHDWVCGTPYVLRAIDNLAAARRSWSADTSPSARGERAP
ncbi:MAG: hypothetical protein CSB44_07565 [Gammaproteobacteria bacterium]|nr:MAG: hypothetical protein CSB44_07565 [Gammaproteobacteria bacterium]